MGRTHRSLQDNLESTVHSMFTVPNVFGVWHRSIILCTNSVKSSWSLFSNCFACWAFILSNSLEHCPSITSTKLPVNICSSGVKAGSALYGGSFSQPGSSDSSRALALWATSRNRGDVGRQIVAWVMSAGGRTRMEEIWGSKPLRAGGGLWRMVSLQRCRPTRFLYARQFCSDWSSLPLKCTSVSYCTITSDRASYLVHAWSACCLPLAVCLLWSVKYLAVCPMGTSKRQWWTCFTTAKYIEY